MLRYLVLAAILVASPVTAQAVTEKDLLAGLSNPSRWVTYSGDYAGHRHSPLDQITPANAASLEPVWTFRTGVSGQKFEATPLLVDGVLYVTGALNRAWAIDALTGRSLWEYKRPVPQRIDLKVCCGPVNRGFAIHGDLLFMGTLDAHLVALHRHTGKVVWDVKLADMSDGYAGTAAPLVVGDKVIAGIAGGEYGVRGFLDAYDVHDGKRLWRFWTVPEPGQPGSESWPPDVWQRGGGPTWLTGTYDPALNLVYWGVGNPSPDYYGADRSGDNLYTNSLVALDADSGKLRWHFQLNPHDEHDWDANQIPVLADLPVDGNPRKVVMMASRNSFFFTLDRETGEFLRAFPFAGQTWADLAENGRPVELPSARPTAEGALVCPNHDGGTNWMSPSYDRSLGLFFVTARETCDVYFSEAPAADRPLGLRNLGGRTVPGPVPGWGALRAFDPLSGEMKWELRHATPSWAGVLSTAGGVVFSGDGNGAVLAADARTGSELWRYQLPAPLYAAPVTYQLDGRQYVTIADGPVLTSFALPR